MYKGDGLKANDRSEQDQRDIQLQGADYDFSKLDSYSVGSLFDEDNTSSRNKQVRSKNNYMYTPSISLENLYIKGVYGEDMLKAREEYSSFLQNIAEIKESKEDTFDVNTYDGYNKKNAIEEFKRKKAHNSFWYNEYVNNDKFDDLSDKDWELIRLTYEYLEKNENKLAADNYLNSYMYQHLAKNQGFFGKMANGIANMGATAAGSVIEFGGIVLATAGYLFGAEDKKDSHIEGAGAFTNYVNYVLQDELFQRGQRMARYGSLSDERNKLLEESGALNFQIFATEELRDKFFSVNTVPEVIGSHGFTLATMGISLGASSVGKGLTWLGKKGLSAAAKKGAVQATAKAVGALSTLETIGSYTTLGLTILPESFDLASEAYERTKVDLDAQIENDYKQAFDEEVKRLKSDAKENNRIYLPGEVLQEAENNLQGYRKELDDHKEILQAKAARNTLVVNLGVLAALGATLKSALQAPIVQKSLSKLKIKRPHVDIVNGKAVNTMRPYLKYLYGLKEVSGEGIEEGFQGALVDATTGAASYNMKSFIDDLYNEESMYEVGDYISGTFWHALGEFGKSAVSKETLQQSMMGMLGSALLMPGIKHGSYTKTSVNPETGKIERHLNLKKGEDESWASYLYRILPVRSGYVEGVKEFDSMYNEAEMFKSTVQQWLDEGNNPESLKDLIRSLSFGNKILKSVESGDDQEYRNSITGKLISDALILQKMKGTAFYNLYMKVLDELINEEDPNSEYAKAMIKNIRENQETSGPYNAQSSTNEEIYSSIRENAIKIKDIFTKTVKENEALEKRFGNIDSDVKHSMIYGSLMLDDWKSAKEDYINDIKAAYNVHDINSLSRKDKKQANNLMTYFMALSSQGVLEENLKNVEERIKILKEAKGKGKTEIDALNKAKLEKEKIELQIKNRDKVLSLSELKEFAESIESVEDLFSLPVDVLYKIMNPSNTERLPENLRNIVTEANNEAIQKDKDIHTKLENLHKINTAIDNYNKEYSSLFVNPDAWNDYLFKARLGAVKAIAKRQGKSLNETRSYEDFIRMYEELLFEGNPYKMDLINNEIKDSEFYKKYKKNADKLENFAKFNKEGKSKTFNDLSIDYRDLVFWAIRFLNKRGIEDFTDINAVYTKLFGDPNDTFEQYIASMNTHYKKSNSRARTLPLPDNNEFFESYKDVISEYMQYNKDLLNAVPSKPSNTPLETPAKKAEEKRVKEQQEDKKTPSALRGVIVQGDDGKPLVFDFEDDDFEDDKDDLAFLDEDVKKDKERKAQRGLFIERLLKGKKIELATKTLVNSFIELFDITSEEELLALEDVSESFLEPLSQEELNLIESEKGKDSYSKEVRIAMLHKGWTENAHRLLYFLSDTRRPKQESNKDITGNENGIEALPITNITEERWPLMANFINKHGIKEYLQENEISTKEPVYFIVYEELYNSEYIQNMDDLGKRVHLPIIVAVKKKDGTYQPIGIMPSGANEKQRGHKRLDSLRHIIIDLMNLNMFKFGEPVEVNGAPLVSNLSHKSEHEHTAKTESNNNIQDVFINDLSLEDKNSLNSSRRSESSKNILEGIKNKFLKGLLVVEEGGRKILYYVNELGLKYLVKTKSIEETKLSSGLSLIDLFNARSEVENTGDIKNFNDRTVRFFSSLRKFFKEKIALSNLIETDGKITYADNLEENLNNAIKNYFVLDSQYDLNLKIVKDLSGLILLELKLTYPKNEDGDVVLKMPIQDKYSDEFLDNTIADLLLNLLFVEKEDKLNYRMNGTSPVVHWGISYDKMTSKDEADSYYPNSIYNSNILAFNNESVKSGIPKVVVSAPNTSTENPDDLFKDYIEDDSKESTEVKEPVKTSEDLIKKEEIIRNEGAPTDEIGDASNKEAVVLGKTPINRVRRTKTKTPSKNIKITKEKVVETINKYLKDTGKTEQELFVKINDYLQENDDKVNPITNMDELHNYVDTKDMLDNILSCIK